MMYSGYVKRHVELLIVFFGILGIILILLGAIVEVPYTAFETVNNYPYNPPGIWADEILTLQPHTYHYYSLDLLNENNSLIYVKVEKATDPIVFTIKGPLGYGFNESEIVTIQRIPSRNPPEKPFEYFWTPPAFGEWDFILDNPYDTATNVTVKIIDYRYNTEWQEKVTLYHPPLNKSFAYAGIALIVVAIAPIAYQLYKTRKEMPKKPWWQDKAETEKTHEAEETGKLK